MKKIIITVITTIFMIAPTTKGQTWKRGTLDADFPTVNVLTGVNAKISFGLWRFEPFLEIGQYFQIFEESMMTGEWRRSWIGDWRGGSYSDWELSGKSEYYVPRFANMQIINLGTRFRITNRSLIIVGCIINFTSSRFEWYHPYLGYIRRESLSQRTSIELSILLNPRWPRELSAHHYGIGTSHGLVAVGAGLNFEIFNNFYLTTQLMYLRRLGVNWRGHNRETDRVASDNILTQNLIDFSIGIHYHIPIFGGQQQAPQRPPRQRVAPHHRALPCPPGQMRHGRSWDRPSSVFNHPSGR